MIRFLLNPAGGRGRAAAVEGRLAELARRAGADLVRSQSPDDLTDQARRAAAEEVERLVVAGGDGTLNLAVQGLAGSRCALGIVPLGSGNDLAGSLGVPPALDAAVERALTAEIRPIDLVRVSGGASENQRGRLYAGVAGVGFDSAANEVGNRIQRLKGPWIYVYAVLHTLVTFRAPRYRLRYLRPDGSEERYEGRAMMVMVANTTRLGGGMRIAPQALPDDGALDLVIVRKVSKLTLLRLFPRVYKGTHVGHPAYLHARVTEVELALDRPLAVYGDGERLIEAGEEPVRFEILPRALAVAA